jgi:PAS domain S-box-containing protein
MHASLSSPIDTEGGVLNEFDVAQRLTLLTRAIDAAPALFALFEKSTRKLVYLNHTGRRWLDPEDQATFAEYTLGDLIGLSCVDRLDGDILLQATVKGRWIGECMLRDVWGSEFPVNATVTPHTDSARGQRMFCLQAALRHGTSANQASSATDHELLHALLETLPDSVYFKDLQSRFVRVSRALAAKSGLGDPARIIGLTDFDRYAIEPAQKSFNDEQRIIRTGETVVDQEEQETWPDGRVTWVSTTKLPLRLIDGRIVGTFGISRDITTRKQVEQQTQELQVQLQLAQKLESIGRLAAGIAHEINTPTQYITDNVHFLVGAFASIQKVLDAARRLVPAGTDEPPPPGVQSDFLATAREEELDYLLTETPKTLQQSLEGLRRIARIVSSLKEFAHPHGAQTSLAELERMIGTAVNVSRHEWKYVAHIVTEFDPTVPPVPCVADEFNQVILNLIINASHAIEAKLKQTNESGARGTITIRTRRDDTHAIVEVEDTGVGIPEEIRDRIFDPFFTTKDVGKGTGQGLAIVQSVIVKHHQGSVDFTSTPGQGSTFRLRLPLQLPANGTNEPERKDPVRG